MISSTYPLLNVSLTALLFMPMIFWIILVAYVFRDIFRNAEMSGVAKAWWALAQVVLPIIGSLLYFLINGGSAQCEVRALQVALAHSEVEANRVAQIALELRKALEMANAAIAAHVDQFELVAQAQQDAKAAQVALALQAEQMIQLAQATQTVKSVLNEQSDQLSRLSQATHAARVALDEQGEQIGQLTSTEQLSQFVVTVHELRAVQDAQSTLLSQLAQAHEIGRTQQADQSDGLARLAERVRSNPLGLDVEDVEAYIRRVARSKE